MRSNAEDLASAVLSPKRMIPEPAWNMTGLILLEYRTSLCSFDGLYVSLTALRMAPLAVPAVSHRVAKPQGSKPRVSFVFELRDHCC